LRKRATLKKKKGKRRASGPWEKRANPSLGDWPFRERGDGPVERGDRGTFLKMLRKGKGYNCSFQKKFRKNGGGLHFRTRQTVKKRSEEQAKGGQVKRKKKTAPPLRDERSSELGNERMEIHQPNNLPRKGA